MKIQNLLMATACLFAATGIAAADDKTNLHVNTDIVSWEKPLTEAQCLEKAKSAITAASAGLTTFTAMHSWVGTKTNWVISVDCIQSYKANAAYLVVVYGGTNTEEYNKVKSALSKGLGGKSEMTR